MKLISRILAGCIASVAVLGLTAPDASATPVAPYAGNYTYIADFVPGGDPTDALFFRSGIPPSGTLIDDYFIFDIDPDGNGQLSINVIPIDGIDDFTGGFYEASGFSGCATGTVCTTLGVIGGLIAEATAPLIYSGVAGFVPAGQYAIRITGTTNSLLGPLDEPGSDPANRIYSGQVTFSPTAVPEPATMALFGLGLLGAGFARRRRS